MHWSSVWALLCLREVSALAVPSPAPFARSSDKLTRIKAEAFAEPAELKVAEAKNILELKARGVKADSSKALLSELASGTTPLNPVESGGGFAVDVSLDGDSYDVIFDTGSSDLWVFESGVKCVGPKLHPQPAAKCDFGPEFSGSLDTTISGENFNITYGDGEFLIGTLGDESVELAGITVNKQEMAVVSEAYWVGDGVVSGLIGFAYSSLTSAFKGTNPAVDGNSNNIHYPNWITNAIKQGLTSAMFSVAIERGSGGGGGQVAIGGLPSISFDHSFTSTPLEIVELTPHPIEKRKYSYYTIQPDGVMLNGKSIDTSFYAIVDTGTTLLYLPTRLAKEINAAYDPPSQFIEKEGVYENYCNAKPPDVSITIGGTNFAISGHELLLKGAVGKDPATGGCVTGVQPTDAGFAILGDVFLKNVVAVFDIGASEMKFAPHETY